MLTGAAIALCVFVVVCLVCGLAIALLAMSRREPGLMINLVATVSVIALAGAILGWLFGLPATPR